MNGIDTVGDIIDDLLDSWDINNTINLFILEWLPPGGLQAVTLLKTGKPSRGRNVSRIFAHMHEIRCSRLDPGGRGPAGVPRFSGSETPTAAALRKAFERSGKLIRAAMGDALEGKRTLKGWKRSPAAWLAYLMAHEAHHRSQAIQALKQSGIRPPDEVLYGVWGYWGGYALKKPPAKKRSPAKRG